MVNPRLNKLSMTYKYSSVVPNPDNKDNSWKGMTPEYSYNSDKNTSTHSYR
jgi:hypothetical protein